LFYWIPHILNLKRGGKAVIHPLTFKSQKMQKTGPIFGWIFPASVRVLHDFLD